jgi:hypothetical protein
MSPKEPISILNASVKTHFIAIGIFSILTVVFYIFMYVDRFKDIRNKIEKWTTSISGSQIVDVINETENEIDDESINETTNLREILSPF